MGLWANDRAPAVGDPPAVGAVMALAGSKASAGWAEPPKRPATHKRVLRRAVRKRLGLTARQLEVLAWTAQGKSNGAIGLVLGISPRTVQKHLESIFAALGVEGRTSAVAVVFETLWKRQMKGRNPQRKR
nr:helix-turn-helix transcriptional regulator [Nitrospirota bacterium]